MSHLDALKAIKQENKAFQPRVKTNHMSRQEKDKTYSKSGLVYDESDFAHFGLIPTAIDPSRK